MAPFENARRTLDVGPARPLPFQITVRAEGPDVVFAVEGEVDMSTAPSLRTCLDQGTLSSAGAVVVDLAAVTFLDSSGLAEIIRANKALSQEDRSLVLRNPCAAVQRVFEVVGIDRVAVVELDAPAHG